MDRETLVDAIKSGPVRVTMNDGAKFIIRGPEFAIVDEIAAHVLIEREDGKMKARILSLVTMTEIEHLEAA